MSKNSNDDKRLLAPKVVEDGPMMRSVAIMSPAASVMPNRTDRLETKMPFVLQNRFQTKQVNLDQSKPVEAAPWKVTNALKIPSNYRMDRSHIKVLDSAQVVSKRISDLFFRESIVATYDNDQAVATGANADCLKFRVRLWDAPGDGIFVEIQRNAGCGIEFQAMVREIFRCAKADSSATKRSYPPMPRSLPKLPDIEWESSTKEAIQIALNAFKDAYRIDSHALAMESLVYLSSSESCRVPCAKMILSPESEILPTIISLVQRSSMSEEQVAESNPISIQDCYQMLHRDAVTVVANCLHSLQESGELKEDLLSRLPDLVVEATLTALVSDIAAADTKPHDAAASCRCLNLLCHGNMEIKQYLLELGLVRYISSASKCRHYLLQQETMRLLSIL